MDTNDSLENLILDFLQWLEDGPRPYEDVMNTWKTSCPRFPVWEDAVDRGFVERGSANEQGSCVSLTMKGVSHLRKHRDAAAP